MKDTDKLLAEIKTQLDNMTDFSEAQFHVKKHIGMFNNTDFVKMTNYKFAGDEKTIKAMTMIVNLVKAVDTAKEKGNLSFSLNFDGAGVDRVSIQDFKKLK